MGSASEANHQLLSCVYSGIQGENILRSVERSELERNDNIYAYRFGYFRKFASFELVGACFTHFFHL